MEIGQAAERGTLRDKMARRSVCIVVGKLFTFRGLMLAFKLSVLILSDTLVL